MIESLREHWSIIVVLGSGLIWAGRVRAAMDEICQKLREHHKAIEHLQADFRSTQQKGDCLNIQSQCQTSIRKALDDYRNQFRADILEIKQMIRHMDEKREESRKELFELWRDIDEKREMSRREIDELLQATIKMVQGAK